jgi:hypothetical protein
MLCAKNFTQRKKIPFDLYLIYDKIHPDNLEECLKEIYAVCGKV